MSSFLLKSSFGFAAGFSIVWLGIPEAQWSDFSSYTYKPTSSSLKYLIETMKYYSPKEMNRRKQEEAFNMKGDKLTDLIQIIPTKEEEEFNKRRVKFFNELQNRIRKEEQRATIRGLTKKEREQIIKETMEEFFPEAFPNALEIVKKQLEKEGIK
ncbi:unnamed protein product [Blepharisma stoltei]|uniref:Uncharacterized protein n=1 Tax=Blepharisma stoltei TaxID=1481888 RepID=A0AAU9IPH1_9CILI|nr:unnamed protein product [Blepharisma stoltei]